VEVHGGSQQEHPAGRQGTEYGRISKKYGWSNQESPHRVHWVDKWPSEVGRDGFLTDDMLSSFYFGHFLFFDQLVFFNARFFVFVILSALAEEHVQKHEP
jgi:hypothetical protein